MTFAAPGDPPAARAASHATTPHETLVRQTRFPNGSRSMRHTLRPLLLLALLGACDSPSSSVPGAPARMDVVSGDLPPNAVAGQELAAPLVVRVLDDDGDPVPGYLVNFVVTAGEGRVFAGASQTNAQGEARERWTMGTVAGDTQVVEVRAVDATTGQGRVFATFRAVAGPAAATHLSLEPLQTSDGTVGEELPELVTLYVSDAYGNRVPGAAVTWAAVQGGGTLTPVSPVTDAQGTARARWRLGTTVGPQVGQASVAGQPPVTFTARATVGPAAQVEILTPPLSFASLGQQLGITVASKDRFGNPVSGAPVSLVSLNSAVVSLVSPATAVAQANGSTKIVAVLQANGAADTVDATVQQVVTRLVVSPAPVNVGPGGTATVTAAGRDARDNPAPLASPVTWTTSNPAVATVAANGTVTGQGLGTATVTATSGGATGQVQVFVNAPPAAVRATMGAGAFHTCALTTAGEAYCWGDNESSQLGAGLSVQQLPSSTTPRKVVGGHTFVALGVDYRSNCGLTAAGAVYCWGLVTGSHTPLQVSGGRTYESVSGTCGITTAGALHCFNRDLTYTHVNPGVSFAAVDGNCALSVEARLYCNGQLVTGLPPLARLGAGSKTAVCALTPAGQPYCSPSGQSWSPQGAPVALTVIATGPPRNEFYGTRPSDQVCAISAQGRTYCGYVGGTLSPFTAADPYAFVGLTGGGEALTTQYGHYCGMVAGGQIYCWGSNLRGELGDGTFSFRVAPVLVTGGHAWATPGSLSPGAAALRSRR
jgi:hypothetical protein